MISSIQLAKICGVSQGTVDRAMHNRPGVSEKTRRKILEAAERLGYRPNPAVREIMDRSSKIVGAIIPALNNIFFMDMMSLVKESLAKQGKMLLLTPVHGKADFFDALEEFAARKMHGVMVVPPEENLELPSHLTQSLPVLSLLSQCKGRRATFLGADEVQTGKTAVEYLEGLGHRRIMHVTYPRKAKGIDERTAGYKLQMNKLGLKTAVSIFINEEAFFETMKRYRPTALFCHNDWLAMTIMRLVQMRGMKVPGDVSILGVDHTPTFQSLWPELCSMEYPLEKFVECVSEWVLTGKITTEPGMLKIVCGKTVEGVIE
jgi:LacI family transcriptional regulator